MKFKNFVLGFGIVILFMLVLWQGFEAFYPSPEWGDYCDEGIRRPVPRNLDSVCEFPEEVNVKQASCGKADGYFIYEYDSKGCVVDGVCDDCQIEYNDAQEARSQVVFLISLVIGIAALVVGFFFLSLEPVGSALMVSGLWAFFWGTAINFRNFSNITRFLLLLAVLVVLVVFTWKINSARKGGKGFWSKFR